MATIAGREKKSCLFAYIYSPAPHQRAHISASARAYKGTTIHREITDYISVKESEKEGVSEERERERGESPVVNNYNFFSSEEKERERETAAFRGFSTPCASAFGPFYALFCSSRNTWNESFVFLSAIDYRLSLSLSYILTLWTI